MSWFDGQPYIPVAQRKKRAERQVKELRKQGCEIYPVDGIKPRGKIATSFWGHAWCRHLESFSDYENRLPRGRSYVRNSLVLHLAIETGEIQAMVQGSELYELVISIDPIEAGKWEAIKAGCRGRIGSLIELLQGRISDEIMQVVTDRENGLFPTPGEIHFNCNCPDYADMCKHVAAALYGVGARLDSAPELLFKLRGVEQSELIAFEATTEALAGGRRSGRRRTLSADAIGSVFGIDTGEGEEQDVPPPAPKKKCPGKTPRAKAKKSAKKAVRAKKKAKGKRKKEEGR
ncbi:MAG: hypothetical protein ACLFO5_03925 [Opitutales bacterium]